MKTMGSSTAIKGTLRRLFPKPFAKLDQIRIKKRRRKRAQHTSEYINRFGLSVNSGPFAGMMLVPEMVDNAALPTLVGSFESELQVPLCEVKGYRSIINIGSSYGYYAVGFARLFPESRVLAFESDEATRNVCRKLAEVNEVDDRIELYGTCDAGTLANVHWTEPCLVFCDCEGGEYEILQPGRVPQLLKSDLIVELHDTRDTLAAQKLLGQFEKTHNIQVLHYGKRNPDFYPTLQIFTKRERQQALDEFRWRGHRWAVMRMKERT